MAKSDVKSVVLRYASAGVLAGDVVEVDSDRADFLIANGHATLVVAQPKKG